MDSKQVKCTLKEAKEAIKNKEIEKAINLCKVVLKADRKNYLGLVLFGAALQESESKKDAPNAFRKAIELSPDQILAWQGLASYYEKEGADKFIPELLPVYKQLLLLEKENTKLKEIIQKLNNLTKNVADSDFVGIFALFLDHENELRLMIAEILYNYFSSLKFVPENHLSQFEKVLLIKIEHDSDKTECIRKYLNILYQQRYYHQFLKECERLLLVESADFYSLELLCRVYSELSITEPGTDIFSNINEYCDLLLKRNENSTDGLLTKAIILLNSEDYVSCRDILYKVSNIDGENWLVHYYLSYVYRKLYCYNEVVTSIFSTRKYISTKVNENVVENTENWLLEALGKSENVEYCAECFQRCTEILSSNSANDFALKCYIRACIILQKWELVESNINHVVDSDRVDPEVVCLKALYYFKTNDTEKAISTLLEEIRDDLSFIDNHLLLGKLYWERSSYKDSVNYFFKAGKLAPHIYVTFLYLGHFYRDVNVDLDKARRCYEKAFQLNRNSDDIVLALSDIYRRLDLKESNLELLNDITSRSDKTWAWMRLGLCHLDNGDTKLAVNCLRSTIRKNPENSCCWGVLGDAYFAQGSYTAALKSYHKFLELDKSSVYAPLQIATIKRVIGLLDESIEEFRILAEKNPKCVPALKGLSEACFIQARESFDLQLLGSARDLCQEAADALANALKQRNRIACIWKLFADICMLASQLPTKISYLSLPSSLIEKKPKISESDTCVTVFKGGLLNFSLKCYLTAVHLSEDDKNILSYLWHDIAYCYNLKANFDEGGEKKLLRSNALTAAKRSVSLGAKIWEHWNLFGVIALSQEINDAALAQHCFINAIKLENTNAVSWSNLGNLYLQLEDVQLANEAFQNAQKVDPTYSRSWIGQVSRSQPCIICKPLQIEDVFYEVKDAIIAESVDHVETADLFYHTIGLGYHQESAKGFAEWVCKILKNWDEYKKNHHCYYIIEKMFGLQVAAVALTWYTVHNPDDSCATNMLSIFMELCSLHRSAVSSSKISIETVSNQHADIVRSNLGRQLRKLEKYKDAIEIYGQITEIDFITQCDLALTLYLAEQYDEALSQYESAIHCLAPDDGCIPQVMVATAAMNYLRDMREEAKTMLLHCYQLKPVSVYGLFSVCAFGMLNQQFQLSKLVLKELESFKHNNEYTNHIALFNTYYEVLQGNFIAAVNTMSKFVHSHPGDASLWFSLCLLLLNLIYLSHQDFIGCSTASAFHARCAITLGRSVIDISKISSMMSLSYLLAGKAEESLRSSIKAVFTYPDVAENWAVLIAVQYSRGNDYASLIRTIQYVRHHLNCSKLLNTWLVNVERKVTSIIG